MSLPFSVTSIMRNEVDLLPRYLESIEKHFGKIGETSDPDAKISVVIVDTGSTDGSIDLARSRGCKVIEAGDKFAFQFKRQDARHANEQIGADALKTGQRVFDFAAARNHSLEHVETKWALSLDICDIVVEANVPVIIKSIEGINAKNDKIKAENPGVLIPDTADNYKPDPAKNKLVWGFTYTLLYGGFHVRDPLIQSTSKLFDKSNIDGRWRCMVHEVFSGAGHSQNLVRISDKQSLVVRHAQRADAVHSYLPGLAFAYLIRPPHSEHDRARLLYYFARELYYRGYNGNASGSNGAKKFLNKVCESRLNWIKERSAAACHLAGCYKKEEYDKRRQAYIKACTIYGEWREPYLKLAEIAWDLQSYPECAMWAESALLIQQPNDTLFAEPGKNYGNEPYRLAYIGYTRWVNNLLIAGGVKSPSALKILNKALDIENAHECGNNVNIFGWELAYRIYHARGELAKAKEYVNKCYVIDPKKFERDHAMIYNSA